MPQGDPHTGDSITKRQVGSQQREGGPKSTLHPRVSEPPQLGTWRSGWSPALVGERTRGTSS